jgi:hypothetical protein
MPGPKGVGSSTLSLLEAEDGSKPGTALPLCGGLPWRLLTQSIGPRHQTP